MPFALENQACTHGDCHLDGWVAYAEHRLRWRLSAKALTEVTVTVSPLDSLYTRAMPIVTPPRSPSGDRDVGCTPIRRLSIITTVLCGMERSRPFDRGGYSANPGRFVRDQLSRDACILSLGQEGENGLETGPCLPCICPLTLALSHLGERGLGKRPTDELCFSLQ